MNCKVNFLVSINSTTRPRTINARSQGRQSMARRPDAGISRRGSSSPANGSALSSRSRFNLPRFMRTTPARGCKPVPRENTTLRLRIPTRSIFQTQSIGRKAVVSAVGRLTGTCAFTQGGYQPATQYGSSRRGAERAEKILSAGDINQK